MLKKHLLLPLKRHLHQLLLKKLLLLLRKKLQLPKKLAMMHRFSRHLKVSRTI